jgi:Fe-S-cluster containining protein
MCCDGTLFDNVQLGLSDDVKKIKALGLPVTITRARTPVVQFRQPCMALCADRSCRVYADRPMQCRTFECGVFKDVQAGRMTFAAALRLVKRVRRKAENIRRLLRLLGDADEQRPLGDRFHRTQLRLQSGATDEAAAHTFSELGLAMHQFNLLAHKKFYSKADTS